MFNYESTVLVSKKHLLIANSQTYMAGGSSENRILIARMARMFNDFLFSLMANPPENVEGF